MTEPFPTERGDLRNRLLEMLEQAKAAHEVRDYPTLHKLYNELSPEALPDIEGWPLALVEVTRVALQALSQFKLSIPESLIHDFLDKTGPEDRELLATMVVMTVPRDKMPGWTKSYDRLDKRERAWRKLQVEGLVSDLDTGWGVPRYYAETVRWVLTKRH